MIKDINTIPATTPDTIIMLLFIFAPPGRDPRSWGDAPAR